MSEIVFIGTSDAFGAGGRRQSAIFVRAPSGGILLDCGATTLSGLQTLEIERDEIDTILLSHFHGDHFGGVPQLLLAALYEDRRRAPLRIAGPTGVEARVRHLSNAMGFSLDDREWSFPLLFEEFRAEQALELGPVRVLPFETHHSPESVPHGLRLELGSRRMVYSGDTGWFDALPARVAGADLFVSECTYAQPGFEYHLNYELLLEHFHGFDCGRVLLTHLGAEMAHRRGRCEIETADDGLQLKL